ncbi:MAG: hypothetical protein JSW12_22150 [Deltaproteobacteria bacterium]|nr:MAG: hypothetical protein JSW12_22150 [Deltaproteobacteria bacterium]
MRGKLADGAKVVFVFHSGKTPLATVSQCQTRAIEPYATYPAMQYLIDQYVSLDVCVTLLNFPQDE